MLIKLLISIRKLITLNLRRYNMRERALNCLYAFFDKSPRLLKCFFARAAGLFINLYISSLKTPSFIVFFVTNKCNADCRHCFYRASLNNEKNEFKLAEIEKIARSLKNKNSLLLTGGEPFLNNDLTGICKIFSRLGRTKKIRIATNGFLTERILSCAEELLKDKINLTMQVSLDALGDRHDEIRGLKGLFARAVCTIERLKALQKRFPLLEVDVIATVTKASCGEIGALRDYVMKRFGLRLGLVFVRELGQGVFGLDSKYLSGIAALEDSAKLPGEKILRDILREDAESFSRRREDFIRDFSRFIKQCELDIIFKAKRPLFKCTAVKSDLVIYPDGNVSFCEIAKPFCNLKDYAYDVGRLWGSPEAESARKVLDNCYCSHPCHMISSARHNSSVLLSLK